MFSFVDADWTFPYLLLWSKLIRFRIWKLFQTFWVHKENLEIIFVPVLTRKLWKPSVKLLLSLPASRAPTVAIGPDVEQRVIICGLRLLKFEDSHILPRLHLHLVFIYLQNGFLLSSVAWLVLARQSPKAEVFFLRISLSKWKLVKTFNLNATIFLRSEMSTLIPNYLCKFFME